jgi:hypothetical protein
MAITFPLTGPVFVSMDNTEPSYLHYVDQILVPALGDDAFWTLSNFTIDGDGFLDASAVAATSLASRYIPGMLAGHLYKVVIIAAAADDPIVVTMGGVSLGTISAPGTYTYYVRTTDGEPLLLSYPTGSGLTASITSVTVVAQDPINPDLIPVA